MKNGKKAVIIALSVVLALCMIVMILTGGFQKGVISGKIYRPANVFEEIWNLVLAEQYGKAKTVLTTATKDAEVDFDVGFFQNIQIPEHRLAIGWETGGKALFFSFSVRLGVDGAHIKFIYDYKSKSLSGNTVLSYLTENFLSPYFDWCEADDDFSSAFGMDSLGNYAFQPTYKESPSFSVYWNLDRAQYSQFARKKDADGFYCIRFAAEGKLMELKTPDTQIVAKIDSADAMGLALDGDVILEVLDIKDFAVEKVSYHCVTKIDGNTISTNHSVAAGCIDLVLTIPVTASIMDVRPDSEAPGQPIALELLDEISIYCDMEGVVTAVFLRERYDPETDFSYEKDASTFLPGTPGVVTSNFVNTAE